MGFSTLNNESLRISILYVLYPVGMLNASRQKCLIMLSGLLRQDMKL